MRQPRLFARTFLRSLFVSFLLVSAASASSETRPLQKRLALTGWNAGNQNLPLVVLPATLPEDFANTFAYPLNEFDLPLIQTLYRSSSERRFVLLVHSAKREIKFVNLDQKAGTNEYTNFNATLVLTDHGENKSLRVGSGTYYRFARLGDGEFHCVAISDPAGLNLSLSYNTRGELAKVMDPAGRTFAINYSGSSIRSVSQEWFDGKARKSRTWWSRIEYPVKYAHAPVETRVSSPGSINLRKPMPRGATALKYTSAMQQDDRALARVFGGVEAVAAANGFEPAGLARQYPLYRGDFVGDDGIRRRGHLSYAMHVYGSNDGTVDTPLYVPAGFTSHSGAPTPSDAVVTFFYPQLGHLRNVTVAVFHVANFQLTDEGDRIRIGDSGGRGGSHYQYRHAHIEFYRGNTGLPPSAMRARLRIDPARVVAALP